MCNSRIENSIAVVGLKSALLIGKLLWNFQIKLRNTFYVAFLSREAIEEESESEVITLSSTYSSWTEASITQDYYEEVDEMFRCKKSISTNI